jgi:acyl phosphate:glycerol-3-phosphate acyltransferase
MEPNQVAIFLGLSLFAYLLGSVPFGVLAGLLMGKDIRKTGSGNIGATNVLRTLGAVPGISVLLLDLLKGFVPVYLGTIYLGRPLLIIVVGLMAIIGHTFPVFLGFKGGKGAATGLGVLLGISPLLFLITACFVAAVIALSRYVSLGTISGVILLVFLMYFFNQPVEYTVASFIVALLIIIKHVSNIKRLLAGTENRLGTKHVETH